jgi:hypothetical protein
VLEHTGAETPSNSSRKRSGESGGLQHGWQQLGQSRSEMKNGKFTTSIHQSACIRKSWKLIPTDGQGKKVLFVCLKKS